MTIHKEGYVSIAVVVMLLLIINLPVDFLVNGLLWLKITLAVLSLIPLFLVLYFFRFPVRNYTVNDELVISGADGHVVAIEEVTENRYFNEERIQVSVFMSVLNVHANFAPVSGKVIKTEYYEGRNFVARHPKASMHNEQMTTIIKPEGKSALLVRQIAGIMARRVVCYAREGKEIKQSEQLGFIKFGSRLDLLLPKDSEILVSMGQKVTGGITAVARFK